MKGILKKYRGEIILAAVSVLSILITLLLNYGNSRLRIAEIKNIMAESVSSSQDIDHAGLIIQYRFRMDLYKKEINEFEADIIETKASAMFPSVLLPNDSIREGFIVEVSSLLVNTVKSLLGKPQVMLRKQTPGVIALGAAYYYERNSLFNKALEKYNEALKHESRSRQRGGIMLHQGFCLSMKGSISDAVQKYSEIIKLYPDDPVSVTASILLQFLHNFSREADMIKEMPDSPEKIEKLIRLIAFNESLKVLENLNRKGKQEGNLLIHFYKARFLESAGRTSEAMTEYQNIIINTPSSEQAKYANRRILIMSIKSGLKQEGIRLADKNNTAIKDKTLNEFITKTEKITSLINVTQGNDINTHYKNFKSFITETEKKNELLNQYKGRYMKIITSNGDVIIGTVTDEDPLKIKVRTIVGEATILKNEIKKSELK